ncbi:hypothetical protein N7508_001367 [Penicillium antarcticum]|uniref:uncharacterized protein n=1 Tax=Penicillium antarcticum TaxID=416450 RepID=UPI00239193E6|nr:uncharacterized protein N7508_001367 [Penicillium antarcticum]KAJ5316859.1 hypothetical protein N7508_001367 [Penicillium antarcticum]
MTIRNSRLCAINSLKFAQRGAFIVPQNTYKPDVTTKLHHPPYKTYKTPNKTKYNIRSPSKPNPSSISVNHAINQTTLPIQINPHKKSKTLPPPLNPPVPSRQIHLNAPPDKANFKDNNPNNNKQKARHNRPIHLHHPPSPLTKTNPQPQPQPSNQPKPPRPVLLTFHGGGFTIGHAKDDARWCSTILKAIPEAISISINYRLAPEHPFPTALDDSVDAILWLWKHAEEYNLDQSRFVLSGASAGGNLVLGVPFRLGDELRKRKGREGDEDGDGGEGTDGQGGIRFAGIVAFYPPVAWTKSREERDSSNPIARKKSMISPGVFRLFDESYLGCGDLPRKPVSTISPSAVGVEMSVGEVDMAHPYLSPGLAPDQLIQTVYPPKVAIYTCGWDPLLVEGETFRERLLGFVRDGFMESVGGFMVEGVVHGFDKRPSFWRRDEVRVKMYGDAVREVKGMWDI